jgi:hydrogenase maturation protein HypF
MTSGNISDEPQVTSLDTRAQRLAGIADAMLMHESRDRQPHRRFGRADCGGQTIVMRRARGYAPSAVPLPTASRTRPDLLAFGGELKATFCVVKDGAAILSQHQGDLEDVSTFEDYQRTCNSIRRFTITGRALLVADMHPEYLSAKLAKQRAAARRPAAAGSSASSCAHSELHA